MEIDEKYNSFIDEIVKNLNLHSEFELLWLKHDPMLSLPGLKIDLAHRKVYCRNQEIRLTAKEYSLLCLFVANEGYVLTYDQIYEKVWGEEAFGSTNNAIKCHIRNLREKLGMELPDTSFSIRCEREVGYCFEMEAEENVVT